MPKTMLVSYSPFSVKRLLTIRFLRKNQALAHFNTQLNQKSSWAGLVFTLVGPPRLSLNLLDAASGRSFLPEQKRSEPVKAPSPGLPFMRGAGRKIHVAVRNPRSNQLVLVRREIFGALHGTAAEEEDFYLLVKFRRVCHGAIVKSLQ